MKWRFEAYPTFQDGKPVFTSGFVEIEVFAPVRFASIKAGPHAEPTLIPRPLDMPAAKWKIVSHASEDLRRFIRGKYWCQIDRELTCLALEARGALAAAREYRQLDMRHGEAA